MEPQTPTIRITRIGTSAAPGGGAGAGMPLVVRLVIVAVLLALFIGVLLIALPLGLILFGVGALYLLAARAWGALTGNADRLARRLGVERADREGRRNVRVVDRVD